jgi:hypothetical protein
MVDGKKVYTCHKYLRERNNVKKKRLLSADVMEFYGGFTVSSVFVKTFHHHQPINVPTAAAQALLMDYPQEKRVITHHAGSVRIGGLRHL